MTETDALRKERDELRAGPKVKPLVWESKFSKDWRGTIWQTVNEHYHRTIVPTNTSADVHLLAARSSEIKGGFATIEDAKAAAQADYEARILSALEPAPTDISIAERTGFSGDV